METTASICESTWFPTRHVITRPRENAWVTRALCDAHLEACDGDVGDVADGVVGV